LLQHGAESGNGFCKPQWPFSTGRIAAPTRLGSAGNAGVGVGTGGARREPMFCFFAGRALRNSHVGGLFHEQNVRKRYGSSFRHAKRAVTLPA
jgi:hypothetical protein